MAELKMRTMFIPHSSAGYYAANNQFQMSGPRGFIVFKLLKNNDMFVRVDLPGAGDVNKVKINCNKDKNKVSFGCTAHKESEHDQSDRIYYGSTGTICHCCKISSIEADLTDGVFSMILRRFKTKEDGEGCKKIILHSFSGGSQSSDGAQSSDGSGRVLQDHPYVIRGPKGAFEAKPIKDGGIYGKIDLPGVAEKDARVFRKDGEVRFSGTAHGSEYETDRYYRGSVALPKSYKVGEIQHQMKNGILRITISRQ